MDNSAGSMPLLSLSGRHSSDASCELAQADSLLSFHTSPSSDLLFLTRPNTVGGAESAASPTGSAAASVSPITSQTAAQVADLTPKFPRWAGPRRLMALFCFIMFVVWLDVGIFASNGVNGSPTTPTSAGSGIQGEFGLSYFEDGVLPAMFMVGLMLASVLLAELAAHINAFRLIGVGMAIWMLAVLATGLSQSFAMLLVARMCVGAGEASIITLSAPFVDDVAPAASKARWFALLSVFPSVGVAVGYILGPAIANPLGWRACFYVEAGIGVPIVLFTLLMPAVDLRRNELSVISTGDGGGKGGWRGKLGGGVRVLWADICTLHRHPIFLLNNWGYVPIQACLGAFTYWGPKAAHELYGVTKDTADFLLGVIVIATAVVGTMAGGLTLDRVGSQLRNALAINLGAVTVALAFLLPTFLFVQSFAVFCGIFSIGLLGLFVATAPLYAVGMWSIPVPVRPAGQAFLVVTMHLLGDVPSPPIVGAIRGATHSWRASLGAVSAMLAVSMLLYGVGVWVAGAAPDYREDGKLGLESTTSDGQTEDDC